MRIEWSDMAGVSLEPVVSHQDERGSFDKIFDGSNDVVLTASQLCLSLNRAAGTVRGLHVQVAPHLESKSIWCSSGELFDVIVDTRPEHGSFGHWAGVLLDGTRPQLLRIPPGVAHGYQTLAVNTAINYLIDGTYAPEAARTIRWDDPTLGIDWPHEVTLISDADRAGQPWPAS